MPLLTLRSVAQAARLPHDSVIDVRSPSEFAEDHLPGAINLPVLDDAERARIGTIYKQQSPFLARKLGAALVARNAAAHLEGPLADKPGGWHPVIYCWRGGQRSGSFATILSQVGWRVDLVDGGYKSWRRLVVEELHDKPVVSPVVVLDGNTGSAKTELLLRLKAEGVQVLDLEGLANHRGSLFGERSGGQPGQKAFESALALELAALDPDRPVLVEAESSRIGERGLPKQLWAAMCQAPRIRIEAPLTARAAYLARAYRDLVEDAERLSEVIGRLRPLQPADRIKEWRDQARDGRFEDLARGLMQAHYDPRYNRHRARFVPESETVLRSDNLDESALVDLTARISAAVDGITARTTLDLASTSAGASGG